MGCILEDGSDRWSYSSCYNVSVFGAPVSLYFTVANSSLHIAMA